MPRLSLSATQGGADAFVAAEIATGLSGQTTTAFRVLDLQFEYDATILAGGADEIEIALSRRTKTAMPTIADVDVMYKFTRGGGAAAGSGWNEGVVTFQPARDLLIVEDPIFFLVDSASLGVAQTIVGEVFYEVVSISAIDRLTLLTQSLSE